MSLRQPDLGHVTQIQTDVHVHLAYCLYTLFITAVIFRKKHPALKIFSQKDLRRLKDLKKHTKQVFKNTSVG